MYANILPLEFVNVSWRAKTLVNTSPIVKSAILSRLIGNISPKLDQSKGIYKKKIAFNPEIIGFTTPNHPGWKVWTH